MRLKDKVAIITGGSRGIGYATADKFLKEGATVILTASSQGSADKAVAQLKEKYPDATVAGISPNLSNLESVRNAFREAASKYGCIDILVNNAGVSESTPFTEYTEETFDKVMDLNVKGVFNATRAASECMIAKGQGVILSTSSMVSIYGQPSGFAYPASKFAVNGLTVSLARELGPKGIRVNAVAPGITLTDKPVYVICQSGLRSYIACRILAGNGFDCYNFSGGFRFYDAVTNDRCLIESATACGMDRA